MKLLEVKNLSISFNNNGNCNKVVKDISFDLIKGEILGIVGESGSGKTLTALSILGLLPFPKAFHDEKTSIKFNDKELINNKDIRKIRGKKIGFVFQEPMSSLNPLHKVGNQIAETILLHKKVSKLKAKKETIELMKLTGIEQAELRYNSYPHELSGGQRQRIMIAMAVANKPDILIADEPTTALDVTVAAQILDLLIELKQKLKMSIIFISHDLNIIKKISDRVMVMKSGEIVEQGRVEEIFNNPKSEYAKTLISSSKGLKNNNYNSKNDIVEVKDLSVIFPIKKNFFGKVKENLYAVNNVSIKIKSGETLGIVGESGSGKSTLALAVCGLNKYNGCIKLNNKKLADYKNKELRKKIQIVFQDPYNSLNPRMTIKDIVGEGIKVHFERLNKKEILLKIKDILKEVGLEDDVLDKYPHEFSGGQRQRIAIARALAVEPEILILDEPTSALDVTIARQILELLNKIQKDKNLTYLFISHDMEAIAAVADEIAVMKNGKIIELDKALNIINNPKDEYTYKLIKNSSLGN